MRKKQNKLLSHNDVIWSRTTNRVNNRRNSLSIRAMHDGMEKLEAEVHKKNVLRMNEKKHIEKVIHELRMQIKGYKSCSFPCISDFHDNQRIESISHSLKGFKSVRRLLVPKLPSLHTFHFDNRSSPIATDTNSAVYLHGGRRITLPPVEIKTKHTVSNRRYEKLLTRPFSAYNTYNTAYNNGDGNNGNTEDGSKIELRQRKDSGWKLCNQIYKRK